MQLRDIAHHLAGGQVHHVDFGRMRGVQPPGGAVHGDVIPTAGSADLNLGDDFVPLGGERHADQQESRENLLHCTVPFSYSRRPPR